MRFLEYLATRRASFTAQGDFVRYALSDPCFPDAETWQQIEDYLSRSDNPHQVRLHRVAAEAVWDNFQAKLEGLNAR